MAKKRQRVPEVLWRLFHNRARTLADTVISLIPPSPPAAECRCKGRRCLGCSGQGYMSFLLRPDDPSEYRKLLTHCFVVVSDNAPPLSTFRPDCRWSQDEIVKGTIEMIMRQHSPSSNVLCSDYDMHHRSSPTIELLTCLAWGLLLRRVGDGIMVYLLKYTSIFLPLPRKQHYQVAGFPISDFCFKSKHISKPNYQHSSLVLGSGKKRKRIDDVDLMSEKEQSNSAFGDIVPSSLVGCFGCNGTSYSTSFSRNCAIKSHQESLSGEATLCTGTDNANNEGNTNGEHQECSNQITAKSRKRLRQFSWQRHRKRRQLDIQETYSSTQCTRTMSDRERPSERPQSGLNTSMPLQCSCCLVLQTLQRVTREAGIDKQFMFYKLECSSLVFPRKHVLNSLKPNFSCANVLFKDIFGLSDATLSVLSKPCFHSTNCCLSNNKCLYHSLVKLLKNLIHNARRCQQLRLLEKHCSILSSDQNTEGRVCSIFEGNKFQTNSLGKRHAKVLQQGKLPLDKCSSLETDLGKRTPETSDHQFVPSLSCCTKNQVVSFIWAVCRNIVPRDLLGTTSNWRILRRNISRFVRLRRFEKFSLKQCMHKLKTSSFPLLSNKHSSCCSNDFVLKHTKVQSADMPRKCSQLNNVADAMKHKIVEKWIFWLFSCLVVPLVQANFYVTESEHGKQDVFYYRKSIWKKVMNLNDQNYLPLNDASVRNIIGKRSFGFSRVRLRPKGNGVRVLANLKASSRMPIKEHSLKVLSCGLLGKLSLHPRHVKYDTFKSVNNVLRDLHAFLKGLQMKKPEKLGSSVFDYDDVYRKLCPFLSVLKNGSTTVPSVFIVVCDVSKAFDSVNQDKLLSVMKDVIENDECLLKLSHQVVCTKKSLWVRQNVIPADQDISIGSTKFTSASYHSLHGILVNQGWSRKIRKEELYFNLNEHVKRNVLQLDKKYFLQHVGIPQGSVLSSLLCSFYYGHLETNVILPFLEKNPEPSTGYLSERHDDYDASAEAARFFSRLQRGFREYNCYMNQEKCGLNFDIDQKSGITSNRVHMGDDGITFLRWCGLFINCCTLEVQADYTRYLNFHLSSTLTVCWQGKPGRHLKAKLCDYLRPKCHPIFYDSNINSAVVVRLNIYQAFLLCGMKFHCYVNDLSDICRLNAKSYIGIIEGSLRYMRKLIKKRMHSMDVDSTFRPIFQVEKGEVEWLGLVAYIQVLKRKQSRYKELLSLLRSRLIAQEKAKCVSSILKDAVDDSRSSVMWKIMY
ncbi:hypothetical protein ACSBR2_005732 [Camellia fascicularis]